MANSVGLILLILGFGVVLAHALFELMRRRNSSQARRPRQVRRQRRRGIRNGNMASTTGLANRSRDRLS